MPASDRPRRSRAALVRTLLLTAAIVAAVFFFAVAPPRPQPAVAAGAATRPIAGAYHIHTTRSDGTLDREGVARAASRAGLRFAIFTDHGDGTRPVSAPEYIHGVLCIDGVEISTNDGHYVALGLGQTSYPFGGDGDAVAEDVARMGGFGVAAHPFSPRPELAWKDWTAPVDGIEWLNADSEWRDEGRLALVRALAGYPVWRERTLAALLDRPVSALDKWDALAATKPVVALAAHDAHGGFGRETGDGGGKLRIPSYDATFRSFSLRVIAAGFPTGDAARDAELLLTAIRQGSVFSAIDALAAPGGFDFHAVSRGATVGMGGTLPPGDDPVSFTVRADAPSSASIVLLRNGRAVAEAGGGVVQHEARDPGSYRVEVRVPTASGAPPVPWLLSNPIYRFPEARSPAVAAPVPTDIPVAVPEGPWHTEQSPGSIAAVLREAAAGAGLSFRLAAGEPASQFAALVIDLAGPPEFSAIALRVRASNPMRVSAQLRFSRDGDRRWRKSFYADQTEREVRIPTARLRPADGPGVLPPVTRASSLLFVVDLTNAVPGADGRFTISALKLVR